MYGIDIFSDYSFLLEVTVTVFLLNSKKKLTDAVELIVKISQLKPEVWCSRERFTLQNELIEFCRGLTTMFR